MRLKDKIAIVTGSSRSIGRAIAIGYGQEGAGVVVNYANDEAAANEVVATIEGAGGRALAVRADVSRRAEVVKLMDATMEAFGRIDILVNNAAMLRRVPFMDVTDELMDATLDLNLKGYWMCAQEAARRMIAADHGGVIVNMSSASEELAGRDLSHYCMAKGGVRLLTRQIALELAPYGIRANNIAPGLIETDLNRDDIADPEFREYRLDMIPMRVIGTPEDVVGAAVFLASDESRLATGSSLFIDAGQHIA